MDGTLSIFITDDRFAVKTLKLCVGHDLAAARAQAEADLRANPHHLAVEIRAGDELVAVIDRADLPAGRPDGAADGPAPGRSLS